MPFLRRTPYCLQAFVEFETAEEATRAVATLDRQPLVPEGSKRFVRLEQVRLVACFQSRC